MGPDPLRHTGTLTKKTEEEETHDELRREDELLRGVQRQEVLLVEQLWALLGTTDGNDASGDESGGRGRK